MTSEPAPGDDPVRWLLRISHRLPPAEVPVAIDRAFRHAGADSASILLVDFAQQLLVPFLPPGAPPAQPVPVEGTTAGDAFRAESTRRSEPAGPGDGHTIWQTLVDGADRLGVVEIHVPGDGAVSPEDVHDITTIAAALVVSKGAYSDIIGVTRGRAALDVAAELRWTFLPPLTFTGPSLTVSGMLEPAYEIAGDCFDYSVDADRVHLAMFDAMGHGLEASRMANLAVAAYRQCRRQGRSFSDTQSLIDGAIQEQFGSFRFVTAMFTTLDLIDGKVVAYSAGHPPPMLIHGDRARSIECRPCRPLGLGGPPGEPVEAQLEPGDTLVLLSDGITEAHPRGGEQFGEERLAAQLTSGDPSDPVSEIVRRTLGEVVEHLGGDLRDDATLLLARWEGPEPAG